MMLFFWTCLRLLKLYFFVHFYVMLVCCVTTGCFNPDYCGQGRPMGGQFLLYTYEGNELLHLVSLTIYTLLVLSVAPRPTQQTVCGHRLPEALDYWWNRCITTIDPMTIAGIDALPQLIPTQVVIPSRFTSPPKPGSPKNVSSATPLLS
jgi:hypothetical protein